ncbi:hypothetical protein [Zobellia galactanivorans]|uniref:Hypothetical membrane protein n=1 Tax=Zobellia galactanivorans (strain DSM 12802 / CCUG 47099 / CIP 106680 / NCIMB 13871 / Dsij) TaxID=63186 RepID=G0KZX1_ZOBGA|nr:hypothetical protein [Zobellia galactanivorans]MBU3027545.1 hypothetical protein [Zobellia galactanivorans]CAZ97234.1 Hypothetical membrane protein [Zobellia galactanivorans]
MRKLQVTLRTKLLIILGMLSFSNTILAQGGVDGQIQQWGEEIKSALDASVLVFAVVGGFIIFIQYMQGNEQAQKNFIKFIIGLAIFGLVDLIATMFV